MAKKIYRVAFMGQGGIYEVYVENVILEDYYSFVELEGFIFGETSSVVVDPSEERLRNEFKGVERTFVPLHSIIRIDEVEKRGISKITSMSGAAQTNVSQFPAGNMGMKHFSPPKSTSE